MSTPAYELVHFKDGTPAAPAGDVNVKWQKSAPYNDTVTVNGQQVQVSAVDVSAYVDESALPLVIGFIIADGSTGTNVGPELPAPHAGALTACKVLVKQSDGATALTFDVLQNGTSIFSAPQTIAAGTAAGTLSTLALRLASIAVAKDDKFTINISSGTSSWKATIQAET